MSRRGGRISRAAVPPAVSHAASAAAVAASSSASGSAPEARPRTGPRHIASTASAADAAGAAGAAADAALGLLSGGVRVELKDVTGRVGEYSSPEDQCPQCKTDRFLNPRLRLRVSPCYHRICETCIERLFSLGPAPCPQCGHICRKNQFGAQTFADLGVEREVDLRRRLGRIFNRRQEEFPTLQAYNDYLEEVETLTYNAISGIDVASTTSRIAAYEAANRAASAANSRNAASESTSAFAAETHLKSLRVARATARRERLAKRQEEVEALERKGAEMLLLKDGEKEFRRLREAARKAFEEQEERIESQERREDERLAKPVQKAVKQEKEEQTWEAQMLWDYEGVYASIDDARTLYELRPTPASLGGAGASDTQAYEDPWAINADKEMLAKWRAAGYDVGESWARRLRAAVWGLGVAPRAVAGEEEAKSQMET